MTSVALPQSLKTTPRLDRWVRFNADRTVTVFSGKVELGQGIETAIAQIAADELGVSLERLSLVAGDTTQSPDEWYTAGSQSIEVGGMAMRLACAEVRSVFLEAAARELEVNVTELAIRDGTIAVTGTDLRTSYWDLAPKVDLSREHRKHRRSLSSWASTRRGAIFVPRSLVQRTYTTSSFRGWCLAACCGRLRTPRSLSRSMPTQSARCGESSQWW